MLFVIKRLDMTSERRHDDVWPEPDGPNRRNAYLFAGRKPYRKLRVMVDFDLLTANDSVFVTTEDLVTELLGHPLVELFRYSDTGPPAGLAPGDGGTYEGWVVVREYDSGRGWSGVFPTGPTSWSTGAVMGNAVDVAGRDPTSAVYADLSPDEASKRRRADALAFQVARQVLKADIYVSNRDYLHERQTGITSGVTLCRTEEALGLLGLYFRAQDTFPILVRFDMNRGGFYWVGTRELLSDAWRWLSACVQHAQGSGDDSLMLLGGSLIQRFARALQARDQVHLSLNQPQNNDTQDAALADLDVTLVLLMGCVDVLARVANRALALGSNERNSAWQNQAWLETVRQKASQLAAAIAPGSDGGNTLTILKLLRNSVHGIALQGMAYQSGSNKLESLVGLPAIDEAEVRASMNALGGTAAWGARAMANHLHLDPGVFVDQLFGHLVPLLNTLMKLTPVESLAHVKLSPSDCLPPASDNAYDMFAEPVRRSIRWQLGF